MTDTIFNIKTETDFHSACLETFRYQYENVEVYRRFCDYLKKNPNEIDEVEEIPFLPIEMFKNHLVLDQNSTTESFFQSSGTTQIQTRSKHFIADFSLYEESISRSFEQFIGKPEDYVFLGLLPNYSENPHSSLIYMVDFLMKKSAKPENGYFLYNHSELFELLQTFNDQKVILFGVSFALLDFLDFLKSKTKSINHLSGLTVIETGGMKGRKSEMTKDELLEIFKKGFGTERIYSEYSMTELLSQAYSLGNNIYESPNWMRILIRNTEDPFSYVEEGRTGAINIIDLANRHSCSFIATQDLGKMVKKPHGIGLGNAFQVLGRIDHSDIRGCSLLVS
ncbi:LuxE/PaaK family acyltransferase [Chryseobacterium koreense]|uniref:Acyl transferase n=1 Tax=Chryseobacterium koreense CCUG 49689 TaxID=1304281 RepID=A0A0J7J339_9FLAO|nr:acyltransferase [Chryseobacterium koreense]KMQ72454.1 acyl transferase [Chryseobacterium koreense CCUG 49689]MBB5333455.1 phenylacetate-coenzyme A ligase PaaK-like adenylate-forming protein [Chryseobacterium koreense]